MRPEQVRAQVEEAARAFNEALHKDAYVETISDPAQLRRLLALLGPQDNQGFLDLGTGTGYVGLAIAKEHPTCHVIGVDVAGEAIKRDVENARRLGLANIRFSVFDGVTLPFADGYFDGAVCRYAFHHLPRPETTLEEVSRAVRPGGRVVISDAVRSDYDESDFINRFQGLKRDGHVEMLRAGKLVDLVSRQGFEPVDSFGSSISFSRPRRAEYDEVLESTSARDLEAYGVDVAEEEINLTFPIVNAVFSNRG